jgi:predicted DNA-binding protein (MmcQ/YjbR family)
MNIEEIREYCLSKAGTTECFPFDETTLVFKVMGKMFCLINLAGEHGLALKNTPEKIIEMREQHSCIFPAHHMSKVHWNLVMADDSVSGGQLCSWIDESYNAVIKGLTLKLKAELQKLKPHD